MPPLSTARNQINWKSGTFDFISASIKFRPDASVTADYVCTVHPDSLELLLVSSPPSTTTGKLYNHSGKIKWDGEGLAYDSEVIHNNVASEISAVTEKATPVSGDLLLIEDSADSNNKKRVQVGNLPGGSGTDPDAIHDNVASEISAVTEKATPVSGDLLLIEDSADSNNKKRVQVGNLPTGSDTDAIHDNVASEISAVTEKATPVSGDLLLIEDSADSNNKKRVQVGNLPGDADAIHDNVAAEISAITEKATPVSADMLLIEDSAAGNAKKMVEIGNLPTGADVDAIHDNVAAEISAITEKPAPVSADLVLIEDSADSNNKKRAQIGNLPVSDSDAIHDNVAGEILAVSAKPVPVSADLVLVEDSEASHVKKRVQVGNLPSTDSDAIHDNVASEISAISAKPVPVSADMLLIEDSADSNNKKRVTIGTLPTGSDADAIHDNVASEISAVTEKATPVSGDLLLIEDSADSNNKKRVQVGNLPTGSDADAIHDNVASEISAVTEKATPVSGDLLLIEDSADSNNKKRVQVGNLPTGSDADAIHDNIAAEINAITEKTTPVSGDLVLIEDSADSNNKKKVQLGNLPAGGSNKLFETEISSATNSISVTGLAGVTRAVMYLDHINGSASFADIRIYVNSDTTDSNYRATYLWGNGSTASSNTASNSLMCNTKASEKAHLKVELAVIDGEFWARTTHTLQATAGTPEVTARSIIKVSGSVTDLSGMSLSSVANGFGVGTKVVVIDPMAAVVEERKVAIFEDQKAAGTHGGTFTSGSWQDRTLNTTVVSATGITLSSNQVTLSPGYKYLVSYCCPGYLTSRHKAKLYNVTDTADEHIGESAYSNTTSPKSSTTSKGDYVVDLTAESSSKTYKLQHRCEVTMADVGMGLASDWSVVEVYSRMKVERL